MIRPFAVATLYLVLAGPAQAACTDAPGAKVEWRRCYFDGAVLPGQDLSGAILNDTSFSRAVLAHADLRSIDAPRAKFISTDLTGVRLDGATLIDADFTNAKLTGASLVGADLRRTHFFKADLRGADLTRAQLGGADFLNADLSDATWLDGQRHCAAGSIGQCN